MAVQTFNPPAFKAREYTDLNSKVKDFFGFWEGYSQYLMNFLNTLRQVTQVSGQSSTGTAPWQVILAATAITPLQQIQPIVGNAAINQIDVAPNSFNTLVLLAMDPGGFSLATGVNIAANKTVNQGEAAALYFNLTDNLWYVQN